MTITKITNCWELSVCHLWTKNFRFNVITMVEDLGEDLNHCTILPPLIIWYVTIKTHKFLDALNYSSIYLDQIIFKLNA